MPNCSGVAALPGNLDAAVRNAGGNSGEDQVERVAAANAVRTEVDRDAANMGNVAVGSASSSGPQPIAGREGAAVSDGACMDDGNVDVSTVVVAADAQDGRAIEDGDEDGDGDLLQVCAVDEDEVSKQISCRAATLERL